MNKPKLIFASALGAIASVAFVVIITVWAELSIPLKDWLKEFSGHHWTSKSIFSVLVYAVAAAAVYGTAQNPDDGSIRRALSALLIFTALGSVIITAFYAGHHFGFF